MLSGSHLLTVLVGADTPVERAVEQAFLRSVHDAVGMSHLEHIGLAACRPSALLDVVAHHPECRPQAIGCLRQFDARLNYSVCKPHLSTGVDASGSKRVSVVVLTTGCDDEISVAHSHVVSIVDIVLQLIVAAARAVDLHVPVVAVESGAVEIVLPHQLVSVFFRNSVGIKTDCDSHCYK